MVEQHDESGSGPPPAPADLETHEAGFKHPHRAPDVVEEGPRHSLFPTLLGAAMIVTLCIAGYMNMKSAETSPAAAPTTAGGTEAPPAATPAAAPEPSDGLKSLKSDVEGLRADLKALQERIEALPKPAPAPDLGPLNTKVDALSKQAEDVSALSRKLDGLGQRLGSFDTTLTALRGDVDTLKTEGKKPAESAPATAGPAGRSGEDSKVTLAALDQGSELFKSRKYKEANDVFRKLTESNPDDARVWYYAALSRGSATKEWTGETVRMVEKGVELEKAGSPETSKVDAAFADLVPTFKTWLDTYRKAAHAR
jgi:hypothetical protein